MLFHIGQHSGILSTSASDTKLAELEVRYERDAEVKMMKTGNSAKLK